MPDARCGELSGMGIYHDAKPGQVNDATDYSPWKPKPQCKTPDVRPGQTTVAGFLICSSQRR
jgi:hypothetical protein